MGLPSNALVALLAFIQPADRLSTTSAQFSAFPLPKSEVSVSPTDAFTRRPHAIPLLPVVLAFLVAPRLALPQWSTPTCATVRTAFVANPISATSPPGQRALFVQPGAPGNGTGGTCLYGVESQNTPYNSFSQAQDGNCVYPGDTIYVVHGTYTNQQWWLPFNGDPNAPNPWIYVTPEPGTSGVTIDNKTFPVQPPPGQGQGIVNFNAGSQYVAFGGGFTIIGSGTHPTSANYGVAAIDANNVAIVGNTISNCYNMGIIAASSSSSNNYAAHDVMIFGNTVHDVVLSNEGGTAGGSW